MLAFSQVQQRELLVLQPPFLQELLALREQWLRGADLASHLGRQPLPLELAELPGIRGT